MAFDDVWLNALDEAEINGTVDLDDRESMRDFEAAFESLMIEDDGTERDHFPSADEIPEDEWEEWIDFLDEYDLWDVFREDWERYEKAA